MATARMAMSVSKPALTAVCGICVPMMSSSDSDSAEMSPARPSSTPSTLTAHARSTPPAEYSIASVSSVTSPRAGKSESRASVSTSGRAVAPRATSSAAAYAARCAFSRLRRDQLPSSARPSTLTLYTSFRFAAVTSSSAHTSSAAFFSSIKITSPVNITH